MSDDLKAKVLEVVESRIKHCDHMQFYWQRFRANKKAAAKAWMSRKCEADLILAELRKLLERSEG